LDPPARNYPSDRKKPKTGKKENDPTYEQFDLHSLIKRKDQIDPRAHVQDNRPWGGKRRFGIWAGDA